MALQDVLGKAAASLGKFHESAQVVVDDKAKLTTDQEINSNDAATAQSDVKAAISALSDELAALPAPTA